MKKNYHEGYFFKIQGFEEMQVNTRTCLSRNVSRSWQCTHSQESLINSTKNGTEKDLASQWISTSPKSMISFKFYVKTPQRRL